MSKVSPKLSVERIIDANLNRAKEGLRVCEEISRFTLNNRGLSVSLKEARHKISILAEDRSGLLTARNSRTDVGLNIYANELKRNTIADIFYANIQRVKESIRVLEEFHKLKSVRLALAFKRIRYSIYEIEKKAAKKMRALSNSR